jgi:hypothetical protein
VSEQPTKEERCYHPAFYTLDMFNMPRRWDGCPLCERDQFKQQAEINAQTVVRQAHELRKQS